MSRQLTIFLICAVVLTGCRNKTAEIEGILENPLPRQYIFFQELKSNELLTVDSVIVSEDGNFEFKRKVKFPSFYLLKINQNNYLTMLIEPGEKIKMTSHFDSLNYSEIHQMNLGRPDFNKVIDSLDNLGQVYMNEINTYSKKFIDNNITSLATLIALYSQLAPGVYVLNPENDISYYLKVDSSLSKNYPEYEPVVTLHEQVREMTAYFERNKPS
ncbi:MAG: hypothetical protein H6Q23_2038, partial [Bacteroidetes bacterium]|nr:hypothetical protein [Bacteroidota bacterium]